MSASLKMRRVLAGATLLLTALVAAPSADASPTATDSSPTAAKRDSYKVSLTTLCRTRGIKVRGSILRCQDGYHSSDGTLQYYQVKTDYYDGSEPIFSAQRSSCSQLRIAFWGRGRADYGTRYSMKVVTTGGTVRKGSAGSRTSRIAADFAGPFRVVVDEDNGSYLYMTGYAICSTPNGLPS